MLFQAYLAFLPLWALATLGVYGGLIIGLFTRYRADMDSNELPAVLRGSAKLGLVALAFTALMSGFEIADHLPLHVRLDPTSLDSIMHWSRSIASSVSALAVFAGITAVPTGWCLIWEARLRRRDHPKPGGS